MTFSKAIARHDDSSDASPVDGLLGGLCDRLNISMRSNAWELQAPRSDVLS